MNKNFGTNKSFAIIVVSETRISKKTSLTRNINLKNYSFELTPTESSVGGTLLFPIVSHINHTSTLTVKRNQVESMFIEIINTKKANIVVMYL